MEEEMHPPKARMAIRVGVTGHRQESLEKAGFDEALLRASIHQVLVRVQETAKKILRENRDAYAPQDPLFRVISPLAEGSDRFVAEEAHRLGFELQCPIPFQAGEYEKDFQTEESRSHFRELLGLEGNKVFVLDGSPDDRDSAYEAVGRVVLRQSDVLIAIWNGKKASGKGGTAQIAKEALDRKIPTVWITSNQPHSATLLEKLSEEGEAAASSSLDEEVEVHSVRQRRPGLQARLKRILIPGQPEPRRRMSSFDSRLNSILAPPGSRDQAMMLHRFLREAQPHARCALLYRLFCKCFVPSWGVPRIEVEDFETDRREKWLSGWDSLPSPNALVGAQIERSYRRPFIWADVIADMCADRHRSSFIATYLLGALAVLAAFLGSHSEDLPALRTGILSSFFSVELVFIGGILILVWLNKRQHWHERWIEYRLLAEGLRQMRALAPFARVTPSFEVPPHLGESEPTSTWFNWYFRAIVRNAGMVQATVNISYLNFCRAILTSEIAYQVRYHLKNARKHKALHHRLHRLSNLFFLLTLVACIAHISFSASREIEFTLTLCAIVLPAFGAAIQGILHQGDFGKLENRSRALRRALYRLQSKVKTPVEETSFRALGKDTESFSEIQMLEQADWRSLFIIKDISLP